MTQSAIIYCRVSSHSQVKHGHGLESQESRCRKYAEAQGYNVEAVFPDDVSGGGDFMNRPGMVALLSFLSAQPEKNYVIIFDDLKRFARDTEFHRKLRRELTARGAVPECLNFKFEDTPEGEFIETIMAAQGELERKQNRRQVIQKMHARVENGYWVFHAPLGYKYEKVAGHGKLLVRDEPNASILQEALMGFASGRFETQSEVKRFLERQPTFPKCFPNGEIRIWRVTRWLTNVLYAGYAEVPKWKIARRRGHHDGLISLQDFEKIQGRLQDTAKAPSRVDLNADFPLRGFVLCGDCCSPLTAGWSKGKYKRYAYYLCQSKGCESYRKSIPKNKIEGEFLDVLKTLKPSAPMAGLIRAMFKKAWDMRREQGKGFVASIQKELRQIEAQTGKLLDRIAETTQPSLVPAYEGRLAGMENQRLVLQEKLTSVGKPQERFEDMFELSMRFLSNPCKIWESGRLDLRRLVLRMAFHDRLEFCRNTGYRTLKTTIPFNVLGDVCTQKVQMVLQGRIELPTSSLPMTRSTTELLQPLCECWLDANSHWCKPNLDPRACLR